MKYEYRTIKYGDEDLVNELIPLGLQAHAELWPEKEVSIHFERLASHFAHGLASVILIRTDADVLIGYQLWEHFGSWMESRKSISHLRSMFIKPEHRTASSIVRFLQFGIDKQKELGYTEITSCVDNGNKLDATLIRMGFEQTSVNYKLTS